MEKLKPLPDNDLTPKDTEWMPCPDCIKQYHWLTEKLLELQTMNQELMGQLVGHKNAE